MTGRTRQLRIASAARLRSIRSVLRKRRDNQSAGSRSSATGSKECTYDRITHVEGLALLCSPTPRNESGLPGTQLLNSTLAGMLSSSTSTGATSRSRSGCPRGARWSSTSHRMPPRRATDHARGRSLGTASERAHDCRHVFAVTAVRAGVPLGELRELLGHSSLVMVLRYARHVPANVTELAKSRLEAFLAEGERGHARGHGLGA